MCVQHVILTHTTPMYMHTYMYSTVNTSTSSKLPSSPLAHTLPQLNYEFLRRCVASGPVTPMPAESWDRMLALVPRHYHTSPLTAPLLPSLHQEVRTRYEDTLRRMIVQMTLVKPSVGGMEPEPELYQEQE